MSVSRIFLSQTADVRYNAIAGQIKDAILSCPFATLVSDNNPAGASGRVIVLRLGNNQHPLRIIANSGNVTLQLRNIANSSDLFNGTVANEVYMSYLCGSKSFYMTFSAGGMSLAAYVSDLGNCFVHSSSTVYAPDTNTSHSAFNATPIGTIINSDGKRLLMPFRVYNTAAGYLFADKFSRAFQSGQGGGFWSGDDGYKYVGTGWSSLTLSDQP